MVAEPQVFAFVSVVAEPEVFALVSVVPELSSEVLVLAADPEVVFVADLSEHQVFADIAVAVVFLVPVSHVVVEVYIPGRPKFAASPNAYSFPNPSSSVELDGKVFVGSSIGARTNYGLCSIPSNPDLDRNKNLEHVDNNPSPGHNNLSDTNDLPIDATTNHSRKRGLHQPQEQRKHTFRAALSTLVVRQIRRAAADQYQYLHLPLPSWEQELQ